MKNQQNITHLVIREGDKIRFCPPKLATLTGDKLVDQNGNEGTLTWDPLRVSYFGRFGKQTLEIAR